MKFFDELVRKLNEREPFTFVRYGDGEWACLFGMDSKNCDGNIYFTDLSEALKNIVLSQPQYYMGMQYGALVSDYFGLKDKIYPFIWDLDIDWVNADILHRASEFGKIQPFFDALQNREIILVGAEYFDGMQSIPVADHVVIPDSNCWLEVEEIIAATNEAILDASPGCVVLFMASMAANVMIDRLYQIHGSYTTLIDMGSVLDPYLGIERRRYHWKVLDRL